jgi:hypothetical protein
VEGETEVEGVQEVADKEITFQGGSLMVLKMHKLMSYKTLLGVLVIATSVINVAIGEENALIIQMKNGHILKSILLQS